jgi:hypothetical protein
MFPISCPSLFQIILKMKMSTLRTLWIRGSAHGYLAAADRRFGRLDARWLQRSGVLSIFRVGSAGRRGEVARGEGAGGFSGGGVARRRFRAAVDFRALSLSFNVCGAACAKYPARWAVISRPLEYFYRVFHFRVSVGALLSNASALNWRFLPHGRDLARLLEMLLAPGFLFFLSMTLRVL